jgi:CRP/FNR family cyclic AMP-dependent transcriptional regulator
MSLTSLLKRAGLFTGLSDGEAEEVASLCVEQTYPAGSIIIHQGDTGDELFVIEEGQVEILVMGTKLEQPVVVLGKGQILGEMSLLDYGFRSATARAAEDTTVQVLKEADFTELCERNNHIGYIVMRNLAADLSFKLRHRHLATM